MKKLKKINGYLVVRFNDRERREWPGLGTYGVIDAELYTGHLEIDKGVFEYDDADTLEVAIEQARGLASELEVEEPGVIITVLKETNSGSTEDTVDPGALFRQRRTALEKQIANKHYPDTDPRTAAHELYGYARALTDLGMIDDADEDFLVTLNTFGELCGFQDDEGHHVDVLLPYHGTTAHLSPHDFTEVETFKNCTVQTLKCRRCGMESFAWSGPQPSEPPADRDAFEHLDAKLGKSRIGRKVYTLGVLLREDCPENDCKIYSNIFEMAVELDTTIDALDGYPARVLAHELLERFRELQKMYLENYAVKKYLEGSQT